MAELTTVGITIPLGDARIARLKEAYPDLTVIIQEDPSKVAEDLHDIDLLVGRGAHAKRLLGCPNLRWIQTLTAGADAVPFDALEERMIVLTNGSGIHAPNIAEHMLGQMLCFARGFHILLRHQQNHHWTTAHTSFELNGQTLCVIGLGDIGQALGERAAALGMRVTGVRRRPELAVPDGISAVTTFDDMDALLAEADHIAVCLPLTPSTENILNAERIAKLKRGVYIYNTGRGEIIDQDALIEALNSGQVGGAGLDVTTPEPLPADSPLWDMENVLITSHTSGRSPARMDRFMDILIDNIRRYRADEPLRNVVDPVHGY